MAATAAGSRETGAFHDTDVKVTSACDKEQQIELGREAFLLAMKLEKCLPELAGWKKHGKKDAS